MGLFNKKELLKIEELETALRIAQNKNEELGIHSYEEAVAKIEQRESESDTEILRLEERISELQTELQFIENNCSKEKESQKELAGQNKKISSTLLTQQRKVKRAKELYKAMLFAYDNDDASIDIHEIESLFPTITVQLQCLTYQALRKEYRTNENNIAEVLQKYEKRYTTKGNRVIYQLMVIALQAELQNILSNMKYDKLDKAISQVDELCQKYDAIVTDGNQQIAPTIKKFIAEMHCLFINAVKIEYEYYVKKEREKEEQAAIREQMRQEAEERRELEAQKKRVEKEESKYLTEIENVKETIASTTDESKLLALQKKIEELQDKLNGVEAQKEDIINRQNGKAGNVYVISNLGSFGEEVFKIGMTRRLEPMDRVKELGDASVPFSFDVHAMIFSEDAVSLEGKLHQVLDKYRLNKVNMRKEFFRLSLDTLEETVLKEDPAASFDRTMLAEQYRQSLSISEQNAQ